MQTAALVANEIGYDDRLRVDKALRPDARWDDFGPMLRSYNAEVVIVVGHNPNLSQFVGRIISNSSNHADIDLKKSGIARVDYDGRNGELEWLLTPKFIREVNAGFPPDHSNKAVPASPDKKLKKKEVATAMAKIIKIKPSKNRAAKNSKKRRNTKKK
jgi:hypothetical protein